MHQQFSSVTPQDHLDEGTATPDGQEHGAREHGAHEHSAHEHGASDHRTISSEATGHHGADPGAAVAAARWRRLAPLAVGGLTAAATLAVTWWNPSDTGAPLCPSKFVFGVDCPFCGTTRATAALARGQFGRALDHNALWVVLIPFIGVAFVLWVVSAFRDRPMPTVSLPRWAWIGLGVAFVAFGVSRNLDVTAFTRWLGADAGAL